MSAFPTNQAPPRRRRGAMPSASTVLFLLSLVAGTPQAAHEIAISQEQMRRIGISLITVEAARSYVTDYLPACVSRPPHQARVLSAPRGGLVTALRTAASDEV